jgi:hypothetical protein
MWGVVEYDGIDWCVEDMVGMVRVVVAALPTSKLYDEVVAYLYKAMDIASEVRANGGL